MRKSIFVILVAAIVFLGGCSGGGDDGTVTTPSGVTTLSCSALSLGATSAESLDTVSISGIPQEMGEPYLLVSTLDESNVTFSIITSLEDNSTVFYAPLYPSTTPAEGGDVLLTLTDGTYSCNPQPFTMTALPSANANVTTELASALQTNLDLMYVDVGTDAQSIRDVNFTTMPREYFPLYLAQQYLDYYVTEIAKLTPNDRDLINRVISKIGINEQLALISQDYQSTPIAPLTVAQRSPLMAESIDSCRIFSSGTLATDITTASQLSAAMNKQSEAQNTIDQNKNIFEGLGYASVGVTFLNPAIGGAIGGVTLAVSIALDYSANMNPNSFGAFTFSITDNGMFNEDYIGSPIWSDAEIDASNNGWSLTKPVVDIMTALLGGKVVDKLKDKLPNVVKENIIDGAVAVASAVAGKLNAYMDVNGVSFECLKVDPHRWGPIDVTSLEWVKPTYSGRAVQEDSTYGFSLIETGDAQLRLDIINAKFGGNTAEQERSIRVETKTVLTTASKTVVDKNEEITVTAEMYNTDYPDTEPLWEIGAATEMSRSAVGNFHTIVLKMPIDNQFFPITVTATSQTKDLPLSGQANDSVVLKLADVEIQPRGLCVQPSKTAKVSAIAPEGKSLDWSATGGDFNSSTTTSPHIVTYTAPSTKGEYTITAAFSDDTSVNDEINVTVGNCIQMYVYGGANGSVGPPKDDCMNYGYTATTDSIEFVTPDPFPLAPERPGTEPWEGREEFFVFNATENFHGSRLVDATCETFNLPASSNADMAFTSDTEGNMTMTMDVDYSYECTTVDGNQECSKGEAGAVMSVHHFMDIHQEGNYTLAVDLECTPSSTDSDYYAGFFPLQVNVSLFRYLSSTGEPTDVNYCNVRNDCTVEEIVQPGVLTLQNVCEPGTEAVHLNIPIPLRAPIDLKEKDTLYMFTSVLSGAPSQNYMEFLLGPGIASGTHNGSLQFNMTAKLAPSN